MNLAATRWQERGKNSRQTSKIREPGQWYLAGVGGRVWALRVPQGKNLLCLRVYFCATYLYSSAGAEIYYLGCVILKA